LTGSFASTFSRSHLHWKDVILSYAAVEDYVIPPLWTIAVELAGSAFVPLAAALVRRGGGLPLAICAAFIISFAIGVRTPYHIAIYLVDFFLGAALTTDRIQTLFRRLGRFSTPFLWVSVAMLWLYRGLFDRPDAGPLGNAVEALAAFGAIGAILYSGAGFSLLRQRSMIMLGDISFSVYLLHFPIMFIMAKVVAALPMAALPPLGQAVMLTAMTIAVTVPAAYATYRWVERPGVWLGKQLSIRVFTRGRPAV
jgi:peptidoglycan/LPS O-acetylase OafA/YrhL